MPTRRYLPPLARCPASLRPARGVGLIEVLIALVVVAIGMLGIAGLQFMSKRSNFEAVQRTAAAMLAQDIIERMRANATALEVYAGTLESSVTAPVTVGGNTLGTEPSPPCTSGEADQICDTAGEMATHDLWEWEQAIDGVSEQEGGAYTGGLTLPTACIYSKVPGGASRSGNYVVTIAWRGPTEMANPTNPATLPSGQPDPYSCGAGSGKYDGEAGTDTHRRILIIETFINASAS